MSQASSSSCGVSISTSTWGYNVGLCRNIAVEVESEEGPPPQVGPDIFHLHSSTKNGRRREGTSNMWLETTSLSIVHSRLKKSRASLHTVPYPYSHLPWIVLRGDGQEYALTVDPFFARLANFSRQRRRIRWFEPQVLDMPLKTSVGHRVPPRSAEGKACALPRSAFGTHHEVGWPRNWFRCSKIRRCSCCPYWLSVCWKGIVPTILPH